MPTTKEPYVHQQHSQQRCSATAMLALVILLQGGLTIFLYRHQHQEKVIVVVEKGPPPALDIKFPPSLNKTNNIKHIKPPPQASKPAQQNGPIKNLWMPPAKPQVPTPPERPKLPTNLGSGIGLRPDHPAYSRIDDDRVKERLSTYYSTYTRNAQAAARLQIKNENTETIFVSVASYRDPECAKTISRAYERALRPERIHFGVYQQNAEIDVDCVAGLADLIECPGHPACGRVRSGQLRAYRVNWTDTLGPTIGRHMSERLFRDEDYVISFDAHTNFAHGWDAIAIDMFRRINNSRAIITAYPAAYSASNTSEHWSNVDKVGPCDICRHNDDQRRAVVYPVPPTQVSICRTRRMQVGRTLSFKHDVNRMKRPEQPTRAAFLAAGFNFARGSRVREVPYDEHSIFLFDGEETSLAVRAWTHGYDFYQPDRDIVSHLYIPNHSPLRPVFWTTDWAFRQRVQFWTMLRMNYILGLHDLLDFWVNSSYIDKRDLNKYGLGHRRRAVDYWSYVRVSPRRDGPEWSQNLCHQLESVGLPPFPYTETGGPFYNNYSDYANSFPLEELKQEVAPVPPVLSTAGRRRHHQNNSSSSNLRGPRAVQKVRR